MLPDSAIARDVAADVPRTHAVDGATPVASGMTPEGGTNLCGNVVQHALGHAHGHARRCQGTFMCFLFMSSTAMLTCVDK